MSWMDDTRLRDLDEETAIEASCIWCGHTQILSPTQLLLRVDHRDVTMNEIATNLLCSKPDLSTHQNEDHLTKRDRNKRICWRNAVSNIIYHALDVA